jgi:hypothetical protein
MVIVSKLYYRILLGNYTLMGFIICNLHQMCGWYKVDETQFDMQCMRNEYRMLYT